MLIPTVIEKSNQGERAYDIFSRILKNRIILLSGEIDDNTANIVIAELLYLDSINNDDISLYINSPGGSVAPTQDLYNRVVELKKTIPVVCSMGDVAASGGYYLSAACDEIYALPGTTTGSIGVIFQFFNVENLVNWAKVQPITIKAGKMKDVGSPFRAVAPEERAYLENLLKEVHEQFIRDVAKGRTEKKITLENLRLIADGRIITGEQALKAGLVDKNGGPKDALNWLKVDKKLGNLNIVKLPNAKRSLGGLLTKVSDLNTASQLLDQLHPVNGMLPMLLPANFQSNPQLLR
jgi:signal peptide peptidase SppA